MSACCIFYICCSLGDGLVIYLWCTCGLWWTCKLIWIDLSTYYYILWWMWYGRMDVWMDEIYMWWMRYICDGWDIYVIYVCMNVFVMMECKKKFCRFGSLCWVLHSAKDAFAERNGHNTRQSWQNGWPETRFSSFAECCDYNTRQRNLKKNLNFAECLLCWHSAKS